MGHTSLASLYFRRVKERERRKDFFFPVLDRFLTRALLRTLVFDLETDNQDLAVLKLAFDEVVRLRFLFVLFIFLYFVTHVTKLFKMLGRLAT